MQAGLRGARRATHPVHQMGAVVVQGRRIISVGYNNCKTHSRSYGPFRQVHAETHALDQAGENTKGATLVVVRKKANGTLGTSRPCEACLAAARRAGIKRLIYADDEGSLVSEDL